MDLVSAKYLLATPKYAIVLLYSHTWEFGAIGVPPFIPSHSTCGAHQYTLHTSFIILLEEKACSRILWSTSYTTPSVPHFLSFSDGHQYRLSEFLRNVKVCQWNEYLILRFTLFWKQTHYVKCSESTMVFNFVMLFFN